MADEDRPSGLSFRTRLTGALMLASLAPLAAFGIFVLVLDVAIGGVSTDANLARLLLFGLTIVAVFSILGSYVLVGDLTRPLDDVAKAVDRVSIGDLSTPIQIAGDDELARLADSHNTLAASLERRNRELDRILAAIETMSPRDGVEDLVQRAAVDARAAFELIDATVILGDPSTVPEVEFVAGEARQLRAVLGAGKDELGVLIGRLPATRRWEPADQDLLQLFTSEVAIAIRNAQLFSQVEAQNAQLLELDAAKDDFLRGVSHNLQTPLTSIRAYAEQLEADHPDRRLGIISEQTERLSRMVRQLLTVNRLESGALRPRAEVLSLATRARKAWEALGADDVTFSLDDQSNGWLGIADGDHLDQVLWALLDNAVKYGGRTPVGVEISVDAEAAKLRMTVSDQGPGIGPDDRTRLFERFARGSEGRSGEGSGLGLYVSRELCRAMGGELALEPTTAPGVRFTVTLPAEPGTEG